MVFLMEFLMAYSRDNLMAVSMVNHSELQKDSTMASQLAELTGTDSEMENLWD